MTITEIIEEYANRYVRISISRKSDFELGSTWSAEVGPTKHPFTPPTLPAFQFTAYGETVENLIKSLRTNLAVCEPIVAHRERYLKSRAALRNHQTREFQAEWHSDRVHAGEFQNAA